MNTLLIEGASSAYGYFDFEAGGWAGRLKTRKMQEGMDNILESTLVINNALPGQSLAGVTRELQARIQNYQRFGLVAVAAQVGLNEAKIYPPNTRPVVSALYFGGQVLRFCEIVQSEGSVPILVGPGPVDESHDLPAISGAVLRNDAISAYADVMRETAERQGAVYVDIRQAYADSGYSMDDLVAREDGSHPSPLGHAVIADAVYQCLPFKG
ncbi:MAG TPA: GDSL-type esterase/lipase family protein [Candidatus Saccharimonadales bacterium]|nr:GDSL-type esterase/lipase family protein [Candidatus Saccharimonadales bacterium]